MTARTCSTCLYGKITPMGLRCYRPRSFRMGGIDEAPRDGFNADHETDSLPEPQRADGDKCGPTRRHWIDAP